MDKLSTISAKLGESLQQKGYLLALAESCTGGLVTAAITEIAGSSAWLDCGFITYSNASKQEMLGVSEQTLIEHGAVSEQTAIEMTTGALKHSHADIAGSITGIAGPSGSTADKPVGTVCFAWMLKDKIVISTTEHFTGDRQAIRHQAAIKLMTSLIELLQTN